MQDTVFCPSDPVASRRGPGQQCLITNMQSTSTTQFGGAAGERCRRLSESYASQLPSSILSGAFLLSLALTVLAALDKSAPLSVIHYSLVVQHS